MSPYHSPRIISFYKVKPSLPMWLYPFFDNQKLRTQRHQAAVDVCNGNTATSLLESLREFLCRDFDNQCTPFFDSDGIYATGLFRSNK